MNKKMRSCITPPDDNRYHCLRGCGDSWDNDPRVAVDCPECGAKAGTDCIAPSGHRKSKQFSEPHQRRRELAFSINPCSCLAKWDAEHASDSPQLSLAVA